VEFFHKIDEILDFYLNQFFLIKYFILNQDKKKGERQVIMALILWAIDVLHFSKQKDAKM
jgi:hypothetical protein